MLVSGCASGLVGSRVGVPAAGFSCTHSVTRPGLASGPADVCPKATAVVLLGLLARQEGRTHSWRSLAHTHSSPGSHRKLHCPATRTNQDGQTIFLQHHQAVAGSTWCCEQHQAKVAGVPYPNPSRRCTQTSMFTPHNPGVAVPTVACHALPHMSTHTV